MKDGSEVDMRRAYSMPRDEDVAAVGPIDPQIGLLRLDREDGKRLAVLYNFASPCGYESANGLQAASRLEAVNSSDSGCLPFRRRSAGTVVKST